MFVRKASGLTREFGLFDTFAFNTLGFALGLVIMVTPLFVGGLFPGANIFGMLIIGTVLTLFNGLCYGLLSAAMPRSGGDYVYNGRILHPAMGFMSNWGFTWSQFLGIGIYTAWITNYALSSALLTLGYQMADTGLVNVGTLIATPNYTFAVGTAVMAVVLVILLLPTKWVRRILTYGMVIAAIGSFITLAIFLSYNHQQFVQIFNAFMLKTVNLPDAYDSVIATATTQGYTVPPPSLMATILSIPIGYWVYIGFTYSVYIGGEVKEPQKNQSRAILLSLAFGFVFFMATFWAYYNVVGSKFNDAIGYLNLNNPSANPIPVPPVVNFFAGILAGSPLVNAFVGVSFFLWTFLLLIVMMTICVRNVFAWSFDRVMPEKLSAVSKAGQPWVASITIAFTAWVLMGLYVFTPFFTYVVNYTIIFSICFWITGLSALIFPYARKDLFDAAPELVKRKIAGIPVISITGLISMILFTLILYSSFALPAFSGPVGPYATGFIVAIYASGVIIYYIARAYRGRSGIDLDLLHKEVPPE
jgi:amino acid transporter